mgnify:CR=1 FL=1
MANRRLLHGVRENEDRADHQLRQDVPETEVEELLPPLARVQREERDSSVTKIFRGTDNAELRAPPYREILF